MPAVWSSTCIRYYFVETPEGVRLEESCLGIVGVGHVGSRIQRMAEALGMRVLLNDPPMRTGGKRNLWICLYWHGNVI